VLITQIRNLRHLTFPNIVKDYKSKWLPIFMQVTTVPSPSTRMVEYMHGEVIKMEY
jgi:hypothetical protein